MQRNLTYTFVKMVKPGSGILRIWDVEEKGFGLRVTHAGHKVAGVTAVFARLNPAGGILAEASQATTDWIAAAMDGRNPRLGEKIRAGLIPTIPAAGKVSA